MDLTEIHFLQEIGEKNNQEDYIWPVGGAATLHDRIFIVCDGVGGSENGEIASRIVSEYIGNAILKLEKPEMSGPIINELVSKAKQVLVQYAIDNALSTDMGTTFTILVLSSNAAFVAWCGDSRIYHIRKDKILYKTADHSLVNSLVKTGEITEEEALNHPRRNLILRAIKADETSVEADYHVIRDLVEGDYFLLCTDGLLENITDRTLKQLFAENGRQNINFVERIQEYCYGKTRDNYSMYLLRTGKPIKHRFYRKKIIILTLLLVVLISAFALIMNRYFKEKEQDHESVSEQAKQTTNDSIEKARQLEINSPKTMIFNVPSKPADVKAKDSTRKDSAAKGNDIPVKKADSTNTKKTDSTEADLKN